MSYGYLGTMRTRPGRRDEVVRILLSGVDGPREVAASSTSAVAAATPMPTGELTGRETTVVGGLGARP